MKKLQEFYMPILKLSSCFQPAFGSELEDFVCAKFYCPHALADQQPMHLD